MQKASVAKEPQKPGPSPPMRRSSYRRHANFRKLVAELALRDIGCAGVTLLLDCSISAARNYIAELVDAGVLASHPVRQQAGCIDRTLYCRTADPLVVRAFLAALASPQDAGHRWPVAHVSPGADDLPARRDPLVAALFGAA